MKQNNGKNYVPKDKELVWAWDYDGAVRRVAFYDAINNRSFKINGCRKGEANLYYAPYEGEMPEWAKIASLRLKD